VDLSDLESTLSTLFFFNCCFDKEKVQKSTKRARNPLPTAAYFKGLVKIFTDFTSIAFETGSSSSGWIKAAFSNPPAREALYFALLLPF